MAGKRKAHSPTFKGRVALEASKGLTPINVLASEHQVQPTQISVWKKQLKEGVVEIFNNKRGKANSQGDANEQKLYEEIGRLKMELDWLKKKTL